MKEFSEVVVSHSQVVIVAMTFPVGSVKVNILILLEKDSFEGFSQYLKPHYCFRYVGDIAVLFLWVKVDSYIKALFIKLLHAKFPHGKS